jgi:hypothetical protein
VKGASHGPSTPRPTCSTPRPLPAYLLKGLKLAGQEAAKELGEQASEQAFEQAKALWDKLRPKVEAKSAALEAAADTAAHPDDEDALAALRLQLKKLLAEDEALAQELVRLLTQARPAGQTVTASGEHTYLTSCLLAKKMYNLCNYSAMSLRAVFWRSNLLFIRPD